MSSPSYAFGNPYLGYEPWSFFFPSLPDPEPKKPEIKGPESGFNLYGDPYIRKDVHESKVKELEKQITDLKAQVVHEKASREEYAKTINRVCVERDRYLSEREQARKDAKRAPRLSFRDANGILRVFDKPGPLEFSAV